MPEGLSFDEAELKLKKYGPNEIEEKDSTTAFDIFIRQFSSVLVWILFIATLVSFVSGKTIEFYFILVIISIIILMGFIQEMKAEKAMSKA